MVPPRFVQAIALINEGTMPGDLARTLTQQLARAVPGFRQAQEAIARDTPDAKLQKLGILEKQLVGPLKLLVPAKEIRLVLDALDRLVTGARGSVMQALEEVHRTSLHAPAGHLPGRTRGFRRRRPSIGRAPGPAKWPGGAAALSGAAP